MGERYRNATEVELIGAMRTGVGAAVDEFIERYQSVAFSCARSHRIPADELDHWVKQLLNDVALWLMARTEVPASLVGLVRACSHRRATSRERALRARRCIEEQNLVELEGMSDDGRHEHALSTTTSQGSIRDTVDPTYDPSPLPLSLEQLVSAMEEGLTDDERQLLSWVSQRVSYTTIAIWLNEPRSTIVTRVTRLRVRLLEAAYQYAWWLDRAEHAEVLRFFRRTGVFRDEELERLEHRRGSEPRLVRQGQRIGAKRVAEPGRSEEGKR